MAAVTNQYDFSDLLVMSRSELRERLATVIADLCNEIELAAYVRSTDGRSNEFFVREGHLTALTEQKWLILKLLDTIPDTNAGL